MDYSLLGINHITFSVSNIEHSSQFYQDVFHAELLFKKGKIAYFLINSDIWLALNEERNILRNEIYQSYTHMAFSINNNDLNKAYQKLLRHNCLLKGRIREDGEMQSLYFQDPDGHKFEFHTGTLRDRLNFIGK